MAKRVRTVADYKAKVEAAAKDASEGVTNAETYEEVVEKRDAAQAEYKEWDETVKGMKATRAAAKDAKTRLSRRP